MNLNTKTLTVIFATFSILACLALSSCKKEDNLDFSSVKNQQIELNPTDLPTFYNGNSGGSIKDMNEDSLVAIVLDNAIHYFDKNIFLKVFCFENHLEELYETNTKLDLIAQKAVEMGIAENDCPTIEDVPNEMKQFWQNVFGKPLTAPNDYPGTKALWGVKAYDGTNYSGSSKMCYGPTYWSLGNFNNKTSSFIVYPTNAGAITWCHKKWYRKPRVSYVYVVPAIPFNVRELTPKHNNNFCSYLSI